MTINPDTFILIICIMAFIFGPCLFILLYATSYIINVILQYFFPEDLPPAELGPDTLFSCPNGLCYLHMFSKTYHSQIINKIGSIPSIYIISAISTTYRKRGAKGNFQLIGDNLAHFEPTIFGESAWDVVDKLTLSLHLIGSNKLVKVSSKPPQGYRYIEIFHLSH